MGGNVGCEDFGVHRLEEILLEQSVKSSDVDGEHRIGGVVLARRLDLLDHALLRVHDVDLDAGLFSECVEQGLDEEGLAIRVEVDFVAAGQGLTARQHGAEQGNGQDSPEHVYLPLRTSALLT